MLPFLFVLCKKVFSLLSQNEREKQLIDADAIFLPFWSKAYP